MTKVASRVGLALVVASLGCGPTVVTGQAPRGAAWMVVHASDSAEPAGIYLYDVGHGRVLAAYDLPPGLTSPQALAFDGSSLWLSGAGAPALMVELDAGDARLRSTFPLLDRGAEGVAVMGDALWTASDVDGGGQLLRAYDHEGDELRDDGAPGAVTDLASDGVSLYALVDLGDRTNAIERIDPGTGRHRRIAKMEYAHQTRAAMTYDGRYLVTVEPSIDPPTGRYDRNALRWIDPLSGEVVDQRPIALRGWITALAWHADPQGR